MTTPPAGTLYRRASCGEYMNFDEMTPDELEMWLFWHLSSSDADPLAESEPVEPEPPEPTDE